MYLATVEMFQNVWFYLGKVAMKTKIVFWGAEEEMISKK
jgi:hypothetical protein